jgi:hypothetical protein
MSVALQQPPGITTPLTFWAHFGIVAAIVQYLLHAPV